MVEGRGQSQKQFQPHNPKKKKLYWSSQKW